MTQLVERERTCTDNNIRAICTLLAQGNSLNASATIVLGPSNPQVVHVWMRKGRRARELGYTPQESRYLRFLQCVEDVRRDGVVDANSLLMQTFADPELDLGVRIKTADIFLKHNVDRQPHTQVNVQQNNIVQINVNYNRPPRRVLELGDDDSDD